MAGNARYARAHEIVELMLAEAWRSGMVDDATQAKTTERIAMWSDELLILVGAEYDAARATLPNKGVHMLGCDEAHQHNRGGMNCCALNCWCRKPAEVSHAK